MLTEEIVEEFVKGCVKIHSDHIHTNFNLLEPDKFDTNWGPKYIRVYRQGEWQRFVHCFINRENGDVLRAATWKAPAKHARGNVFDEKKGLGMMGPHGPAYLT